MGRVWKCSWDFVNKRFIPLEQKYTQIKKKLERDEAISCELCMDTGTITFLRQALQKRDEIKSREEFCHMTEFLEVLQPYHFRHLPSPNKDEKKLSYVLEKLMNDGNSPTVERIIELKKEYEVLRAEPLPSGEFDIIYADPPWKYEFSLSERGDPERHYSTMSKEEICDLEVPSSKNSVLFLWATNPKLKEALEVVSTWGFEYRTNLVWVKDKFGTGYYFRGQHELLLVAKKGEIPVPSEETRPSSVLIAPRKEHSEKPHAVYEMIERMYPNRKYLELFARNRRKGWHSWGLEQVNDC